ncbi:hypothetical protein ACFY1L_49895 [Streptomyces sp. NPDC001663]|uniref:hypothetical protein n=1 Tax=Streptomyces sp. NPDC001663 TaxID=3364597 RepID=UPI0036CFE1F1
MLLPDFDGARGAGELPSVGAFAYVLHDDVVDEVVLELVVPPFMIAIVVPLVTLPLKVIHNPLHGS